MQKELKQLTEKITNILPEIKELKFGCKVLYINKVKAVILEKHEKEENYFRVRLEEALRSSWLTIPSEEVEIIGRTISLEDVLRALDDKLTGDYINDNGVLIFLDAEDDNCTELWSWQLGKNLDEQSEETWIFLNNII